MLSSFTVAAGSAAVLLGLAALFRSEEQRGRRFILAGLRTALDRYLLRLSQMTARLFDHIGTGAIQASFHYCIHRILSRMISLLTRFESYLARLQRRNKRIAILERSPERRTHLDEIASHKEATSLSDEQRRERKEH